jgi:hypothetical protein
MPTPTGEGRKASLDHLKLTFAAEKPPPPRGLTEVALMAAKESASLASFGSRQRMFPVDPDAG